MISLSTFTFSRNCGAADPTCCSFNQCMMSITHIHGSKNQSQLLKSSFNHPDSEPAFPFPVSQYFCLLLIGLSGIVISINPASSKGLSTWFLNLVRSERPAISIKSAIARSSRQLWSIWTWSRLSPDLRGHPADSLKSLPAFRRITVTKPSVSLNSGSDRPASRQRSIMPWSRIYPLQHLLYHSNTSQCPRVPPIRFNTPFPLRISSCFCTADSLIPSVLAIAR